MALIQLSPMIPAPTADPLPKNREWGYEPKLDGWRAIGQIAMREADETAGVHLRGRSGGELTHRFAAVVEQLPLALKGLKQGMRTVVDGEVVARDAEGRQSLLALQRRTASTEATYYIFDLLVLNDELLISKPLKERRKLLRRHFVRQDKVKQVDMYTARELSFLREAIEIENWEGIVAKRLTSRYTPGRRSKEWLKEKRSDYQRGM